MAMKTKKLLDADAFYQDGEEAYAFCPRCSLIFSDREPAILEKGGQVWVCAECAKIEQVCSVRGDFLIAKLLEKD